MVESAPFSDAARVDARDKVRGAVRYAADDARPELAYAMLSVAHISRGNVVAIDTAAARRVNGVRLVLTHEDLTDLKSPGFLMADGYGFQSLQPMTGTHIAYRGQPIALVAADTLEAAIEAAALVRATFATETASVTLDGDGAEIVNQADSPLPKPMFADRVVGDADGSFTSAAVKIDARYEGPAQHQNPMELIATVAEWRDGTLTVHEGTQNAGAIKHGLARELGIPPDNVRVISPSAGGAFGQKNSLQMQTVLVAVAARRLGRPVKLVVPRAQVFHGASFRPASRHHVRMGADRSGRMVAAIYEVDQQTSRHDFFPAVYSDLAARLYGIANFRGHERLVRTDVQTPGYMRAPHEHPAAFAFESAVDELAYALDQDPVGLRIANDAKGDPLTGKPFSSRHLVECLQRGAEQFGWAGRNKEPGSMRADGMLVGWGVAAGAYKAATAPAIARLRVDADATATITVGGHEMGQGIRTALAAVVASKLGLPVTSVNVIVGDTQSVPHHLTAGSWGTVTTVSAAAQAADKMLADLRRLNPSAAGGRSVGTALRDAGRAFLDVEVRRLAPGQPEAAAKRLTDGLVAAVGPVYPEFVSYSYVAHFVEVRVEPTTRRVRVARVVSTVDCGRVVSPRTARSQVIGGVVWGIGAALRERSEVDPRFGGFLNADLAEYVVPVNADIGTIDVAFIDEPDARLNDVGVKGLGEVGMVGVAAAIANAVYHATGRRVRHLPIRVEDLL